MAPRRPAKPVGCLGLEVTHAYEVISQPFQLDNRDGLWVTAFCGGCCSVKLVEIEPADSMTFSQQLAQ